MTYRTTAKEARSIVERIATEYGVPGIRASRLVRYAEALAASGASPTAVENAVLELKASPLRYIDKRTDRVAS